jgi:hypothetical protein
MSRVMCGTTVIYGGLRGLDVGSALLDAEDCFFTLLFSHLNRLCLLTQNRRYKDTYEQSQKRREAAVILDNPELLMMHAQARFDVSLSFPNFQNPLQ